MMPRHPAKLALLVALCLPGATLAADIVISPPAAGGVAITNAAGNTTRLRVDDDGTVSLPGLTALPIAGTGLCIDAATGRIGSCAAAGGSGGTVTSIIAGIGLAGGTITTSGTIGIANGGVGTTQLADGAVTLAKIAANGCTNGQVLRFNGAGWACATIAAGAGTVTSVATGAGLTGGPITATGTIALATTQLLPTTACAANQVPKWNGSAWACAADATGTVNGFMQGGNAFGADAVIGTVDAFPLDLRVNGARVMRYEPHSVSPNVIGGSPANAAMAGVRGAAIGGGGVAGIDPILGGPHPNRVTDSYGTVGGGYGNLAGNDTGSGDDTLAATVGGGAHNTASGFSSTVGGGTLNTASGYSSTVGGGTQNTASSSSSTVGGGTLNTANYAYSTVGGGAENIASGEYSAVGGGFHNTASGFSSTVGGGMQNTASGNFSFAAGYRARTQTAGATPAVHDGTFVWADSFNLEFNSTSTNEFAARATNGFRFVTAIDGTGSPTRTVGINPNGELTFGSTTRQMLNLYGALYGIGVQDFTYYLRSNDHFAWYWRGTHSNSTLTPGAGGEALMTLTRGDPGGLPAVTGLARAQSFVSTSDRSMKEAFEEVNPRLVLASLVAMPLQSWKYRNEDEAIRHLGPMAQDFRAAFGLGYDDRTIATVDADGVALAAIKGLHEVVAEKGRRIEALEHERASQAARIEALESRAARVEGLERELTTIRTLLARRP